MLPSSTLLPYQRTSRAGMPSTLAWWRGEALESEAMGLRADDSRSPSRQIVDEIRRQIALGELEPGAQLPSNAEMRANWEVSNQTVQNAVSALKSDGLVYSVPGRGVFVRTDLDQEELLLRVAGSEVSPELYRDLLARLSQLDEAQSAFTEQLAEIRQRVEVIERHVTNSPDRGESPLGADR